MPRVIVDKRARMAVSCHRRKGYAMASEENRGPVVRRLRLQRQQDQAAINVSPVGFGGLGGWVRDGHAA